jgi:RHS repeat-associated protein
MNGAGTWWTSARRVLLRSTPQRPPRRVAVVAAVVLAASLGLVVAGDTNPGGPHLHPFPKTDPGHAVSGVRGLPYQFSKPATKTRRNQPVTATTWPAATRASAPLVKPRPGAEQGTSVQVGSSPIRVQAQANPRTGYTGPAAVDVRVAKHQDAQRAGIDGMLFSIAGSGSGTGSVRVSVDYSTFAQAYGGNYGSRLRLMQLPACALTTPKATKCRTATILVSTNNSDHRTVTTTLQLSSSHTMVLAATSSTGGDGGGSAGTYSATTLKPSGSWAQGGSTGSFTYSYPITVPPAASSLAPKVALSYDSGSADGQTASTSAQSSWVGDGWSTPQSFVEQSFVSCADSPEGYASPVSAYDNCYDGPVLTLSLDGSTTALVWDKTKQTFRAQNDSGDVIKHVTGSGNGSGTYNTDYWTVTDRKGITYQFGRNELPGWSAGKATTNSVDSEPVYSAHDPNDPNHPAGTFTDPCYNSTGFTSSVCTMAYRWNLDYVTDVHGNAMSYYYTQDTNYYGEDNGASNVAYIRDSHLDHIDYGFRDGSAYGTAPNQVVFSTGDRCFGSSCDPLNSSTSANWQDVPFDLACASGATCTSHSPAFYSTVRLTSITAQQYSTAQSKYEPVDSYALSQSFPATGDGTSPTLWLQSVTHTGYQLKTDGTLSTLALPPVQFGGIQLANRVDNVTDGLPAFYRWRLQTITTETGSVITASYTLPDPCSAPVSLTPATNTRSCYPVSWTPEGYSAPFADWFNKYAVARVTQTDPTGGAPVMSTDYTYLGGGAWHYDDNEVVKAKYRTYGQFRGWSTVQTRTGDGVNDPKTLNETTYYRGMSDDNNTTAVTLTDSQGGHHDDTNALSGQPLETTAHLGDGGPVDHSTITSYWVSTATATRSRTGLQPLTAVFTAPAETLTRQALTATGTTSWRYTETDTSYDATTTDPNFGFATHAYTHIVPADPAYDQCTTTSFAPANTSTNLVGLASEVEVDSVACAGFTEGSPASAPAALNTLGAPSTVNRPDQVVSDTRTFYDDPTFATTFPQTSAPTHGDATMVRKAATWSSGAFTYQTTTRGVYDSYGRATTTYDGNGNATSLAYTMNSVGETTATTATNALNQTTSSTLDPTRNLTLTSTDLNGVVATEQYDPLGRVTSVWLHSRTTSVAADYTFAYQVSNTATTAVTTKKLNDGNGYQTSITIYDGLLRPRQIQTITPKSGRLITDTLYDSRGWITAKYGSWWDPDNLPTTGPVAYARDLGKQVDVEDYYTYDGLGRTVVDSSDDDNKLVSTTTTVYNGDRTTTIPPTGGITQTIVTDPLGRTGELDQYTAAPTLNTPTNPNTGIYTVTGGTTTATHYGYDGHGNQATITAADGSTWTSAYNLLAQATSKTDPDAGTSASQYDGAGNVVQTTDARGKTISYTFDALNRKTGQYDAPLTGQSASNQLASWVYDNANGVAGVTNPLGQLTTTTAYRGGYAYTTQITGFNTFGEKIGQKITIPAAENQLAGTYIFNYQYMAISGLLAREGYPAAGGLPSETVNHTYKAGIELPDTLGGLGFGAGPVDYDAFSRVNQETIGSSPNTAALTYLYDPHTNRITRQTVTRAVAAPATVDDEQYTYDLSGNITRQDSSRLGDATPDETQCYTYDGLDRLTAAWTATDSCGTTPSSSDHSMVGDNLGSTSAYWTTWGIDPLGDRTAQTQHSTTGGADDTTTYTYNGNNTSQAHTLTSTATTGASTSQTSYAYDAAGNMTTRTTPAQGTQTLAWNDTDQLAAVTGGTSGASSFLYDADGNVLLQKDPNATVLYLPNEQLTLNASGTVTGARYYALPGGGVAVRTGTASTAITFEITDQHGTPVLYLDSTAQQPTWRQNAPYGADRGAAVAAPDNHGFLNKVEDPDTGLTEVGAREYDPDTGRFISADPVLAANAPQSLNGYAYANNNPITYSDPSGQMFAGLNGLGYGTISQVSKADKNYHDPGPYNECDNDTTCGQYTGDPTSSYDAISPHVIVQVSDPHYGPMSVAFVKTLSNLGLDPDHLSVQQENLAWAETCQGKESLCGSLYTLIMERAPSGLPKLQLPSIFLIMGKQFKKYGGAAAMALVSSTRFGPMNPGPLPDDLANTFRSSSYSENVYDTDVTLFRVINTATGGNPTGAFWSDTRPTGPRQAQLDAALNPSWPNADSNMVITARMPAGTKIYEGAAAEQELATYNNQPVPGGGKLLGGGSQVVVQGVDPSWIEDASPLDGAGPP